MDLTCKRDFAVRYQKTVSSDHIFSADICFKKGEDLAITTEKLFKQDGISSIYFKDGYYDMITNANNLTSQADTLLLLQNYYDNPTQIKELTKKWDRFFQDDETDNQVKDIVSPFHRLSHNEIEKFTRLLSDDNAKFAFTELAGTFRLQSKKEREVYEEAIDNLNKKQAEDIERLAMENRNEVEINTKVHQHLNQLEEEKILFEKKLGILVQDAVKMLKTTIHNEYERITSDKKPGNGTESISEQPKKTISKGSVASKGTIQRPSFKLQVMLGMQKKYPFKVKLVQNNIATYIEEEKTRNVFDIRKKGHLMAVMKTKFQLDENSFASKDTESLLFSFLNPFYGAFGSALVTSLPYDTKSGSIKLENSAIEKILKYEPDLHFEAFEMQIKKQAEQNTLEEGDVIVTFHSNLGSIKHIFNFAEGVGPIKEGALDAYLCSVLMVAVQKRVRRVILPLEFINRKKVSGSSGELESFTRVIRSLKSAMQQISHNYLSSEFLYEIVLVTPKNESEGDLFGKYKESLKKAFE